ncbi:hypothetical protein C8R45DRAFT_1181872 [Mycena sanguinolenta]|nr:hypothetical protein C8R45DRAFT_1181872 [Mycena sanguinolenta]
MNDFLANLSFDSIGEFLVILFYNRPHGEPDPRGINHANAVARFLRGHNDIKMSDVLPLIYKHRCSFPAKDSPRIHERDLMFDTTAEAGIIHHARPFISTWATNLVAAEARRQIGRATMDDPEDPQFRVRLRASTNGRAQAATHVVTWRDFENFSIKALAQRFERKLSLPMFLSKYMAAPRVKGVFIERKRRPYPMIQVAAISSFILARNLYATGYIAMLLGIWHFVCKSHVDVKRVYCRFGNAVADMTARAALKSMTDASIEQMRAETRSASSRGETEHCIILDNVQEYDQVYEQGIGRQSRLKVGTAGTKIKLQRCAPGAFDAQDYHTRVAQMKRKTMTVQSLFDDIDWEHQQSVQSLHWARVLADFVPSLHPLRKQINSHLRCAPIAKRRMPDDQPPTEFQPLMLNSEHETEAQGMKRAVEDFEQQIGVDVEKNPNLLSWIRGDGASYAQVLRLSKYLAPVGNFRNKITTPEIWRAGATDLNSIAENHYGPKTSSDPSSLSKASGCAGLKRPSNLKSCDYYPTVRNLTLIWTAHLLDYDLTEYFADLEKEDRLPDLDAILEDAVMLVDRYASQAATQNCLRASEITHPENCNPVPAGSPWVARGSSTSVADKDNSDVTTTVHQESEGFTGDRVLRNSEIFMIDFGWWVEMAWAVPEGDIGRVWEIFKIWIFKFAGSSHQNYMKYLLEMYCLLRYEPSNSLHDAILDNLLVRVKKELGTYLPGDQHQEHYNRWLQDMSRRHGGEFDDPFFRRTISPNVEHFLRFKEEIESAFNLEHRSKTHTSPHQRPELRLLLSMFKDEQVHLFRQGRSMGHAAVNQFACGCRQLGENKLADFISTTTCLGEFLDAINRRDVVTASPMPASNSDEGHETRAPSPAPSSSSGSSKDSIGSTPSTRSTMSLDSVLSAADPNEPENDGIDIGSFAATYIDEDNGLQLDEEEDEEEVVAEIQDLDQEDQEDQEGEQEDEQADEGDGYSDDGCNEDEL